MSPTALRRRCGLGEGGDYGRDGLPGCPKWEWCGLQEGERKRSRRGQQRPRLTAFRGADWLGRRPALSGVRASASAPLAPLAPGPRLAAHVGRRAAAAQEEAWSLPSRDVSGSRARTGGPPRTQPGGRSDPCPLWGLRRPGPA